MIGLEFVLIWFAWVLAAGSPGPATLGIMGTSMALGRRSGVIFSLGICAGSAAWGLAAALGMSAVMMTNAWVFAGVKYAGAGYLLYLAVKSGRNAVKAGAHAMPKPEERAASQLFVKGALIHLTNPKAILSWGAIYAIVLPPTASQAHVFATFGILFAGSILVFVGYAVIFSTKRLADAYRAARRGFEAAFAVLFGAASLRILTLRPE